MCNLTTIVIIIAKLVLVFYKSNIFTVTWKRIPV